MRVQFSLVGHTGTNDDIWVNMDSVPREGDVIDWPGLSQAETYVRTVVWYIKGDPDAQGLDAPQKEPFVYVVVGSKRPETGDEIYAMIGEINKQIGIIKGRIG